MGRFRGSSLVGSAVTRVGISEIGAGIDVGDTEANNLAQDRECTVVVRWRPEYMRTSQLHGTVPHASKDQIIGELECASWQCCRRGRLRHSFHVQVCHRKPWRWRCNGTFIRNSCLILQSTGIRSRRCRSVQKVRTDPFSLPAIKHFFFVGVSLLLVFLMGSGCTKASVTLAGVRQNDSR